MENSFKGEAIGFGVVAVALLIALVVVTVLLVKSKKNENHSQQVLPQPPPITPTPIAVVGSQVFTSSEPVQWSIDNTAIASITSAATGTSVTVQARASGTVTIRATSMSTGAVSQASLNVTVPAAAYSITPSSVSVSLNTEKTLQASLSTVSWSVDNSTVASISKVNDTTATVKGLTAGTATITATSSAGTIATATLTVLGSQPVALTVSPVSTSVAAGNTVTVTSSRADTQWSVDKPTIATIFPTQGAQTTVTGVSGGAVVVTATSGTSTATSTITVSGALPAALTVSPVTTSVVPGNTVTVTSSRADTQWSVDKPTIATIFSTQGAQTTVTGVSAGTAVVTATSGTSTATSTITVAAPPIPRKGGRTVVYVNGSQWAYAAHDPTQPTPFTTVIVAFAYTNYQCANQGSGYTPTTNPTSKFDFTLDAFACNGLFQSPTSPIAAWLTKWRATDPSTREIFVSVGGAAYQYTGFGVYDAWAQNPAAVATGLATFVQNFKAFTIDGIDFDYEDTTSLMTSQSCPANPEPWGATMLIAICKALKKALPTIKISHAPQGPYLVPNCTSVYVNNMGGYEFIIKQLGDIVTFYFVQFYNNSGFMACGPSGGDSAGYTIHDIIQYMSGMGCSPSQIVVGKPLTAADSGGCWTPPDLLQWCISTPAASYGGIGFWALTGTTADQDARWAALAQYASPSQNKTASPGTACPTD